MASKALQAQRLVQIINQQLEILKEERNNFTMAVDQCINQVQSEVDAWVNGGLVNQTTCAEMSNRIQQVITMFIEKSVELSDKQIDENETDVNQRFLSTNNNLTSPEANSKVKESKSETLRVAAVGSDASHNMTMRFVTLEETVYSLKRTTEKVKDKIENVDTILKDVLTQQLDDHKKVEILRNVELISEEKLNNKITDLEKRYQETKSNVDDLFEIVTNVEVKLNRIEDENNSVNVSMNELNKMISSVRTCSNDALMSIQDLSKSIESTNQHYNEMSNKMNQLEISINLMSSQYTEPFKHTESLIKDKTDDLIGMVCQLIAKRLTPLEKLNETLNKKVISGDKQHSEKAAIENRVAEISNKFTEIERKCNLPKVGFFALKELSEKARIYNVTSFSEVCYNHGDHFDQSTGIFTSPLNGLYLITIMTLDPTNTNTNIINVFRNCRRTSKKEKLLHCVSINQTVTRFADIEAGEKIYLKWEKIDVRNSNYMCIYFSCFLIRNWT